jgi:hypothetical protein
MSHRRDIWHEFAIGFRGTRGEKPKHACDIHEKCATRSVNHEGGVLWVHMIHWRKLGLIWAWKTDCGISPSTWHAWFATKVKQELSRDKNLIGIDEPARVGLTYTHM